jgi:hypothetical protein
MADQLDQPPEAEKGDAVSGEGAGRVEDAAANLRVSRAAARARAVALLALLLVPIVVWLGQRGYGRIRRTQALEAVFSTDVGRLDVRLSHPAVDRPRTVVPMGDGGATVAAASPSSPPRWALAELERAGDRSALVAAAVLVGDLDRASALLDGMTSAPTADARADVLSDRAAVASLRPNGAADALEAADRALALAANHGRAAWNRAVVLEGLGLPLAAAAAFEEVGKSADVGWAPTATARAERLRQQWQQRVTQFATAGREAESIKRGTLPSEAALRQHPDLARLAFYTAARETNPPEVAQSLAGIAARLEQGTEKPALAALLGKPGLLRELLTLRRSATLANAEAYQKLAEGTGDPWLLIRGAQFLGQARTGAGDPAGAEDAYERALAGCRVNWFPQICVETKIWLAYLKNNRRRIQEAKRWAAEAKRESRTWVLPVFEAKANARLAVAEDLRERFPLARAYATEAALQKVDCPSANTGRELLAKIALGDGDSAEARRQLESVARCGGGAARFGMIGTETLAALAGSAGAAGGGKDGWETGRTWLRETIAQHRAQPDPTWIESMALRLFEARVDLVEDRAKGQGALETLVNETKVRAPTDEAAAMLRIVSTSALVVDEGMHGEYAAALGRLEEAHGLGQGRPCTLGAVVDGSRGVFIARSSKGQVVGELQAQLDSARAALAVPKRMVDVLAGCDEIGVIATAPLLGQPRLLPPTQAWSYLRNAGQGPALSGSLRRLVIYDARPPDDLGLARLPAVPALTQEGTVTEVLQGPAATPSAALERALQMDLIEWHVHGLLDPEVSDAAALALSPEGNGRNLLTASDILKVTLPRKPGVILGACRAGQSARYGAYQWSLPLAFLSAGARWVIASPTPVEDAEAPAFFSGVWQRIQKGASPAVALRDERRAPRWQSSFRDWIQDIVIFQ